MSYSIKSLLSEEFKQKWSEPASEATTIMSGAFNLYGRYQQREAEKQKLKEQADYLQAEDLANAEEVYARGEQYVSQATSQFASANVSLTSGVPFDVLMRSLEVAELQRQSASTHHEEYIKRLRQKREDLGGITPILLDVLEAGAGTAVKLLTGSL